MSPLNTDSQSSSNLRHDKLRGAYIAVVTQNESAPDACMPVALKFPWLPGEDESYWARLCVPMAGAERGTFMVPEVGDQVLVVFEHGDLRRPLVVGGLWSTPMPAPQSNSGGKNEIRVIKSQSGHRIIFDDAGGAERVIIVDGSGSQKVVLDVGGQAVTIESGGGDISIISAGCIRIHGQKAAMTADGKLTIDADGDVDIQTSASLGISASGAVEFKSGGGIDANAPGASAKSQVP